MKKSLLPALLLGGLLPAGAQEGTTAYNILRQTPSAHVAALGGENISLIDDTPAAGWSNPALYAGVSDRSVGLDFMTLPGSSQYMGAQAVKAFGGRHTAAASVHFMRYGTMDETDAAGNVLGTFSAKDIVVRLAYSYLLSDRWAGGATFKTVYSRYADFSAAAIAMDVGLNYYDEERDLSASVALRNVGVQVNAFDNGRQDVPLDLQVGFTKGLAHVPVRFSITMTDLTRWSSSYYYVPDGESLGFGQKLINHFVVGVDILPTSYLYLAAGYNARRAYELKAAGQGRLAGFCFGGGVNLSRFKAGVAYARYHVSAGSLLFNVAATF